MCGIVGVYDHRRASYLTYLGLTRLSHRGDEGFGIVSRNDASSENDNWKSKYKLESVVDALDKHDFFPGPTGNGESLPGDCALGHTRYSTTGDSNFANLQPIMRKTERYGTIALVHNGNLTNALMHRKNLGLQGHMFQGTNDTEVVMNLISSSRQETLEDAIAETVHKLDGSFSFAIMSDDAMYVTRDKHGFRPLIIGNVEHAFLAASETTVFQQLKANIHRDVRPGELIVVDYNTRKGGQGYKSIQLMDASKHKQAFCLFEPVYFMRPDSHLNNGAPEDYSVAGIRMSLGRTLAKEHPADADFVSAIPDSGNFAAQGYAEASKLPLRTIYVRSHNSRRSFIKPTPELREQVADFKLTVIPELVRGKKVIIVDDSLIRGLTSQLRIKELREAGAKEVHMRISCPPTKNPCYYGIDFPTQQELIASNKTVEEIRREIKADSLGYLSLEGMLNSAKGAAPGFCTACWTGEYPTKLVDKEKMLVNTEKNVEKVLK